MSKRADIALVEAGLFASRAKAQEAIAAGLVEADGKPIGKPSSTIAASAVLTARPAYPWVSRAGVKLSAGLDHFGIDPSGLHCLDLGASTGGFSQVLLHRGAAHVCAVDVGHGQLHPSLHSHPRLTSLEGTDARSLDPDKVGVAPGLITCDVSFISLKLVLPTVLGLAAPDAFLMTLIKPQFEAGLARVKKGVVRDPVVHQEICDDILQFVTGLGWKVLGVQPSPIEGQDGNREFLLGARRS